MTHPVQPREPFRIILHKQERCQDDDTDDVCMNLTVFAYRKCLGGYHVWCQPCARKWARKYGAVSLLAAI